MNETDTLAHPDKWHAAELAQYHLRKHPTTTRDAVEQSSIIIIIGFSWPRKLPFFSSIQETTIQYIDMYRFQHIHSSPTPTLTAVTMNHWFAIEEEPPSYHSVQWVRLVVCRFLMKGSRKASYLAITSDIHCHQLTLSACHISLTAWAGIVLGCAMV